MVLECAQCENRLRLMCVEVMTSDMIKFNLKHIDAKLIKKDGKNSLTKIGYLHIILLLY